MVLSAPGNRLVRTTSNSAVAGLPMVTAPPAPSPRRSAPKFSSREQSAHVRISVQPAAATSPRSSSHSAFSGSSRPVVASLGWVILRLL